MNRKSGGKNDAKKPAQIAGARERGGFKASRHGTGKKASAAGPKAEQKRLAEARERGETGGAHTSHETSSFLRGAKIDPARITGRETAADLIGGASSPTMAAASARRASCSPRRCSPQT